MLFLYVLLALACTGAVGMMSARMGVLDPGKPEKLFQDCGDENVTPLRGTGAVLLLAGCFVCSLVLQWSLAKNTTVLNFAKLFVLYGIVFCAAVIDVKRRIIPNKLIVFGLAFRVIIYAVELLTLDNITDVLINDLIGLAIGFGILALASFITRGAIGFGDAKLFGVIGLLGGSFCTYSTLFLSLVLSAVFSVVVILSKKMGRKDSFPFGPCIAVAYIIVILLTSY